MTVTVGDRVGQTMTAWKKTQTSTSREPFVLVFDSSNQDAIGPSAACMTPAPSAVALPAVARAAAIRDMVWILPFDPDAILHRILSNPMSLTPMRSNGQGRRVAIAASGPGRIARVFLEEPPDWERV